MKRCPKCGVEYPDTTTLCPADGIALETTDDSLIGTTLAGKYRIDARLNEGGMGSVYTRNARADGQDCGDQSVASIACRRREDRRAVLARGPRRITHLTSQRSQCHRFWRRPNGTVFLVMEFLSGKTLKHVIREEGPLPLPRIVDIMRQVGDALGAAHAQGVVHRDLKSDNIMLLDTTSVGDHAKVLDFGIAKINEPDGEFDAGLTAPEPCDWHPAVHVAGAVLAGFRDRFAFGHLFVGCDSLRDAGRSRPVFRRLGDDRDDEAFAGGCAVGAG